MEKKHLKFRIFDVGTESDIADALNGLMRLQGMTILANFAVKGKTFCFKDTHREKTPSNKTPALTKSMNIHIWVVSTSNQLFIRGS